MKEKDNSESEESKNSNINNDIKPQINQSTENEIKNEEETVNNLDSKKIEVDNEKLNDNKNLVEKEVNHIKEVFIYINEEELKVIKLKKSQLQEKYRFSIQYSEIILNFVNYINTSIYEKINNSIKYNSNYISFFDSLSKLYSGLSNNLQNTKIAINKKSNEISDDIFQDSIINIKNIIENDFSQKSESIKRITENYNKLINEKIKKKEESKKNILNEYNQIKLMKNILIEKYTAKFTKLFDTEIKITNATDLPDLVIAITDLIEQINQLIREVNSFIENTKKSIISLNNIYNDINKYIKDIIISYINENKNNINDEQLQKFEEIKKKIEENNPEENPFTFSQVMNNITQRKKIDSLLESYYRLFNFSEDVNSEENSCLLEKYKNIDSFFEFLIQNNPKISTISIDELITKKIEVLYYPGFFKSWKECFLYFTSQKHLIICNKEGIFSFDNIIQIFQMDKINFELNSSFEKPFLFQISPSSNVLLKGYNTYSFDALSNQNLFELCQIFKDFKRKK